MEIIERITGYLLSPHTKIRRKIDFKIRSIIAISSLLEMMNQAGRDYIQGHVEALGKVT